MMTVSDIARLALTHPEMTRRLDTMIATDIAENHAKLARLLDAHPDARVVCKQVWGRRSDTWTPITKVEYIAPEDGQGPGTIALTFA